MYLTSSNSVKPLFSSILALKRPLKLHLIFALLLFFCIGTAHSAEVAFAGFAYSGSYKTIPAQFPYSKRFEASLPKNGINAMIQKNLPSIQPKGYTLIPRLDELKGRDQAIAVSLVITNETVSTEQIAGVYKVLAEVRGQAMFFDFKTMTILRAYPFSFAYIDALPSEPTEEQKDESISYAYLGKNGKPGIIDRFSQALAQATIPTHVPRFVQVSNVEIGADAKAEFPQQYGNGVAETWIADTFGEALANKMGMPILPFSKGYAIGNVMSMTVSDGTVYNLKIPEADYKFSLNLLKLKKMVYEETAAGKSMLYGALVSVKLEEPLSAHVYIDNQFKNGEVKVMSSMQTSADDFPAFQDSIRGLFTKLSSAFAADGSPWIKSATIGASVDKQIVSTRELLQSCK